MRLRYTKGTSRTVGWAGTKPYIQVTFSPYGDVEDSLGERLLSNPQYPGWFERVEPEQPVETFTCDICGKVAGSKAGLGSHKRKHKEQSNEKAV